MKTLRALSELPEVADVTPAPPTPERPYNPNDSETKRLERAIIKFTGRELVAGGDIRWKPINKEAAMMLSKRIMSEPKRIMSEPKQTTNGLPGGDVALGNKMIHKAEKTSSGVIGFAEQVTEARRALDTALDLIRPEMLDFINEVPAFTEKIRAWRMNLVREKDLSIQALSDLRKFFLDDAHEKEMARLNDFIRTAERLSALAKDGTLDKIAEVMIKLS